jgi:hypothetical protein
MPGIDISQLVSFGQTVVIIFLVLVFALRLSPRWERVKTAEVNVRKVEAEATIRQSESLTKLADVIKDVAIEQGRAAESNEELRIFLKVAMREVETIIKKVASIESQIEVLKESGNAKVH